MNSTFSWNGWQYYLTKTGKAKRHQFIVGKGWQKAESVKSEDYIEIAKKYREIFYS